MKKWLILIVSFLVFQVSAHAMNLDSYIDNTGNEVSRFGDTFLAPGPLYNLGLGGPLNGGSYVLEEAFQFTVSEPLYVNHLIVIGQQVPDPSYDPLDPGYNAPEKMRVSFGLNEGTQPWGLGKFPAPGNQELVLTNHTFVTDNGHTIKDYDNVHVSFKAELLPGNTYWMIEEDPKGGQGSTLDLSTEFMGKVATPEPATWVFFGFVMFLVSLKVFHPRKSLA